MIETDPNRPMRTFVVECYASRIERRGVAATGDRLGRAARTFRDRGRPIEYVRALLVPDDEVAFYLFLAPDVAVVREAVDWARVSCERIVESIVLEAD